MEKIKYKVLVVFVLITIMFIGNVYAANNKGDLNEDGQVDYKDVNLLQEHLINLKQLPNEKHSMADMNEDGKLTVTDLSFLINLIEGRIEETRKVEMKDILDVYLYRKNGENVSELSQVNVKDLSNKDEFLVKVQMKDMPDFYAKIKGSKVENGELKLELDYENVVQYKNNTEQEKLEVTYGTVENEVATNNSLSSILAQMKKNPTGTFELTRDYDAATITGDNSSLLGADLEFKGTLNGNGHTIYNLSKPIFDKLRGATITDLIIENAHLTNSLYARSRGAIANETYSGCTISNVHVKNITIVTSYMNSGYGSIVGALRSSTIKECSATSVTMNAPNNLQIKSLGGIVGIASDSIITDCYATGTLNADTYVGGIVGSIDEYVYDPTTIKHCISKMEISTMSGPNGSGGILGYNKREDQVNLIENVSLSTGTKAYKIYGSTIDNASENYTINESTLTNNGRGVGGIMPKSLFTGALLKNNVNFDDNIWNLSDYSYDKLPTLKNSDPNNKTQTQQTEEIYIPDQDRLKAMPEYNANKKIAYYNIYKLMPFYDAKYIVLDGKNINENNVLNQKKIKTILAYDQNNKAILAITQDNYNTLNSIRVIFEDNTVQKYTLKFDERIGTIASYEITELNLKYNYNKYIIQQNASVVQELISYIEGLEYDADLKGMVNLDRGHPAYKVHFNEVVRTKENATSFVYNYLSNEAGYSVTDSNDILNTLIKNKLFTNNQMKRILFAYNYYFRFYGVDMQGIKLSDIMLFKGEIYKDNLSATTLISEFWSSDFKNSQVNYQFYRDNLAPRFGIARIGNFIDYAITAVTDYATPDDWFTDNFKGLLVEAPAKGYETTADYRAWKQLKKCDSIILTLMTIPENAGYMISTPANIMIGSQRAYITDPVTEKDTMLKYMNDFANQAATFYQTALGSVDSSYLNNVCDVVIDTRFLPNLGEQKNASTNDLFHQNFNEILNEWSMIGGVEAYAGSGKIYFVVNKTLTSFRTWSHETGHNQVNKIFFKNSGFRPIGGGSTDGITGAEDYPDGNITQQFGDGAVNFNLTFNYKNNDLITTNLTTERIDTSEKIASYYKRMFETIDFLDYVEAKAFLQLTPEEQSKVAVQIYYPGAPNNYSTVGWRTLTKEQFEAMNLRTIDDLYNNQITIKPGVTGNTTQSGDGAYGQETMYIRRWYQPYNENGRTHSHGFKYTAWQMLGIGGYDGGYITYYSGRSRTDADAIQKVTQNSEMTWKLFKQQRYELMENSWNTTPYINADELVESYVTALKLDAANGDRNVTQSTGLRRIQYHHVKRATNDFRDEVLNGTASVTNIKTAEEFIQKLTENPTGNYVLDNDIDLSTINEGSSIIPDYFMGTLNGNGHKLIGNKVPVFNQLRFAVISNLIVENTDITNGADSVGALAKNVDYSEIKNIHILNAKVSGTKRVGLIAGYVGASRVEECSTNGTVTATGNAVGGFIGEIYSGTYVKNSYSIGEVKGNQDVGGFIGYVNSSIIENSFSRARATGNAGTAGFVGQTTGNSTIKNNIALTDQKSGYKFDGRTAQAQFAKYSNNYEYENTAGNSTLKRTGIDFAGKIEIASKDNVTSEDFYKNILGWNEGVWDFTNVIDEKIPKLKNLDPNREYYILIKETISTVDEFIEKLSAQSVDRYEIISNLDFKDKAYELDSVIISGTFNGKIEGNGHTISNLTNATIFENFEGSISNLNIENFKYDTFFYDAPYENLIAPGKSVKTTSNIAVIAKKAKNANFYNMKFNEINILGKDNVAVVVAIDEGSSFEQISVERAYINTGKNQKEGNYASTFISQKTGGEVKNCYVQGDLITEGVSSGGIIGLIKGNVKIENTVANILARYYTVANAKQNGLFIGKVEGTTNITNSVALGKMISSSNLGNKFIGVMDTSKITNLQDCYENSDENGISNANGNNIKTATKQELLTKTFYTETLGFSEEIWNFENLQERTYSESHYAHSQDPAQFPKIISFGLK